MTKTPIDKIRKVIEEEKGREPSAIYIGKEKVEIPSKRLQDFLGERRELKFDNTEAVNKLKIMATEEKKSNIKIIDEMLTELYDITGRNGIDASLYRRFFAQSRNLDRNDISEMFGNLADDRYREATELEKITNELKRFKTTIIRSYT